LKVILEKIKHIGEVRHSALEDKRFEGNKTGNRFKRPGTRLGTMHSQTNVSKVTILETNLRYQEQCPGRQTFPR
jgi:hypothetical protein